MAKPRKYRFDAKAKPVTAIALRDIVDQHYDDEKEDDVFLAGDVIPNMAADQFYGWQKAGLVREATDEEARKAAAPAKEATKAA
jgi:hypothetical protein